MKQPSDESGFFPTIAQDFAIQAAHDAQADRVRRVADHIESMQNCWEEWEGNQGIHVGTRIEINSVCATLAEDAHWQGYNALKAGDNCYVYMAPCKIIEVIDSETFIAEIEYPQETEHCAHMNGGKLRLDILDVWPPVRLLSLERREADCHLCSRNLTRSGWCSVCGRRLD